MYNYADKRAVRLPRRSATDHESNGLHGIRFIGMIVNDEIVLVKLSRVSAFLMDHTQADADLVEVIECRDRDWDCPPQNGVVPPVFHELPSYIASAVLVPVEKTSGTVLGALPDIRRPSITRRSTRLRRPPERLISERPSPPI